MKVSIVIPAYNVESYIEETINSVLCQTHKDWELIVVNDGSTDNTEERILPYLEKSEYDISYYSIPNGGVSNARNYGIERSVGDCIAFLDSDDTFEPNNLEKKVAVLLENGDVDWVYSDMYNADGNMNKQGVGPIGTDENVFEKILKWEGEVVPGPSSNVLVRKKCFEEGVCFDKDFSTAADQDFCLTMSRKYKAKRIAEPLWNYRVIESSMSRNIALMEKDHIAVYKKARTLGYFKDKEFEKDCFANLYFIIGASWLKNSSRKIRGIRFLLKAFVLRPSKIFAALK